MPLIFVSKAVVLALHDEQLAEHGGADGIRDEGLLESALARPANIAAHSSDADLAIFAAAYAYGLARNHPFIDGNKRTSLVTAELFLALNGAEIVVSDPELLDVWLRLADGTLSEADLADWIRAGLSPDDAP